MAVAVRQPRLAQFSTHQATGSWLASQLAAVVIGFIIIILVIASAAAVNQFVQTDLALIVNSALSAMARAQAGAPF
jgi:hypothetical protein